MEWNCRTLELQAEHGGRGMRGGGGEEGGLLGVTIVTFLLKKMIQKFKIQDFYFKKDIIVFSNRLLTKMSHYFCSLGKMKPFGVSWPN